MDRENVAGSLRQWALEEMKYHDSLFSGNRGQSLPTEEDFQLLCQKPLTDVWVFLLKHVRSIQTVKKVKGNLALQQSLQPRRQRVDKKDDEEDEKESLLEKSNQLSREISHCAQENSYLEREIGQTSANLMSKTLAYEKIALQIRNVQRKKSILQAACNVGAGKVAEYTEYSNRIDSYANSVLNKRKESGKDNYISSSCQSSAVDDETESCHDVRLVCEQIGQFFQKIIEGEFDNSAMEAAKADLLKKTRDVHANYKIPTICDSLAANAAHSAKIVRDEVVRVNIALDAQNLSFSINERGQLKDVSKAPSVQKNVQQLLQASNLNYMMRWFEAERHKNESWKVEAQLDDLKAQIHKLIHKALGEHPHNVPMAKNYVDSLLQFVSEQNVAPCLQKEVNSILEKISKAKSEKKELQDKFSQIQDFKQVAEQKQSCIALLARHNTSAPEQLAEKRNQIKSYIDSRSLGSHDTRVKSLAGNLCGSLKTEADKFSSTSLPCLLSISMDSNTRVNALDLSIGPSILPGAWHLFQIYPNLCTDLELAEYKSPDQVARRLRDLHISSQDQTLSVSKMEAGILAACEKAHRSDDAAGIRDLCRESMEHDEKHGQEVLSTITNSMQLLEGMKRDMPRFHLDVQNWWEQPAQHLTPWVKADGMTFDQWMTRWRIAVTAIHTKMAAKQSAAPQN